MECYIHNITNGSWCETLLQHQYYLPALPTNLTFPIYGILCPLIAVATLVTNVIVMCVFMTRKMRSVTTVFLASLAGSDAISVLLWSLVHMIFYGIATESNAPVSYPGCMFHDYTLYLAVMFHTTSVWLTLTLGIQRGIIVVKPFSGPKLWTIRKSTFIVIMTFVVPFVVFAPLFFMQEYIPVKFIYEDNSTHVYCSTFVREWYAENYRTYHIIYFVFRSAFVQIFPCILMMFSTAILAHKLRTERILLRSVSRIGDGTRRDFQNRHRTTLMVVIIMIIFLIVEIPNGVVFIIQFYESFTGHVVMDEETDYPFAILHNFFLILSYHTNFWIYIGLSARFRKTLQHLLCRFTIKKTVEEVFSMSYKTQNSESSAKCTRNGRNGAILRKASSSEILTSSS